MFSTTNEFYRMNLLTLTVSTGAILTAAYFTYGRWVANKLELRDDVTTPACEINDGEDFVPTPAPYLFSQHFSAIAAAGPIVGPITACLAFGWGPSVIWILIGCIFIGSVHDITSLVASVRHKARSIAEIVRENMSRRAYLLFLSFVWIALVYIIVAFTDLTAGTFAPTDTTGAEVAKLKATQTKELDELNQAYEAKLKTLTGEDAAAATAAHELVLKANDELYQQATAEVHKAFERKMSEGAAVASSSMMYLALAVVMGLVLKYTKISLNMATAIFMPLVLLTIWAGPYLPLNLPSMFGLSPTKTWDVLLLGYCFVASIVPVWALLQPRGFLGGYFLTVTIALAFLGIVVGSIFGGVPEVKYPAFLGFVSDRGLPMFPILFVTIACGACSGFHSIISSGTSSKQLKVESDARPVAIGSMLLEGFVAVISLACVMIMDKAAGSPDQIFAAGVSTFIARLGSMVGIEFDTARAYLFNFSLLAFATFIYDTLDVCTRLGRYVLQEVSGWQTRTGRNVCTLITLVPPLYLVLQTMTDPATGAVVPAWKIFWTLFGTANQMLAALTLLGVTVWLLRSGKTWWYTAVPAAFMIVVTMTSLGMFLVKWFKQLTSKDAAFDPNGPLSTILFALSVLLVIEAVVVISRNLKERRLANA